MYQINAQSFIEIQEMKTNAATISMMRPDK